MMYLSFFLLNFVSCFVNGVTNSSVSSINRDPCNYCNVQLTCHCTDLGKAVDSLKVKVEKFTGLNNTTLGGCGAIKSVEAKVESLFALTNKTFGISDVVKSLEAKVESLTGLNNKTSGVSDAVKSLEAKVESLFGLINRTFIPQTAQKPTGNLKDNDKYLSVIKKISFSLISFHLIILMSSSTTFSFWSCTVLQHRILVFSQNCRIPCLLDTPLVENLNNSLYWPFVRDQILKS